MMTLFFLALPCRSVPVRHLEPQVDGEGGGRVEHVRAPVCKSIILEMYRCVLVFFLNYKSSIQLSLRDWLRLVSSSRPHSW